MSPTIANRKLKKESKTTKNSSRNMNLTTLQNKELIKNNML